MEVIAITNHVTSHTFNLATIMYPLARAYFRNVSPGWGGGPKTAERTSLGEISAQRWPKTVKFSMVLAATSVSISAEWFRFDNCID